jgi:hypothetical protein
MRLLAARRIPGSHAIRSAIHVSRIGVDGVLAVFGRQSTHTTSMQPQWTPAVPLHLIMNTVLSSIRSCSPLSLK